MNRRTLLGLAVGVVGLVLLLTTWAQIKDLQNVAAQIPYVVSGGLTGAALIVVGAVVVCTGATRPAPGPGFEPVVAEELRQLAETTEWVADAVERIAGYLNDAAANGSRTGEPSGAGGRSGR